MLLHLGLNVITFRTLLHLGPNVITFRTLTDPRGCHLCRLVSFHFLMFTNMLRILFTSISKSEVKILLRRPITGQL